MVIELVEDREHRRPYALVVGRQEADDRDEQTGGVQCLGVVVLDEHAAVVDAVGQDVLADLIGARLPALPSSGSPCRSARRAPRSSATQHISFEET